ncbi:MAG: PspC domain-containing protein [Candidatus Heimdallarchaeota archaeon]
MSVFCPKCGAANEEFAQYCASCGDDLASAREEKSKKGQSSESETFSTEPETKKVLLRSRTNRMVSGLSAGMAKYFDMEVDIVRMLWIIAFVGTGGTAIIVYLVMAMVIAEESEINIEEK